MSLKVGVHWAHGAYDQARDIGFDFVWFNADQLHDPAYIDPLIDSGFKFILTFFNNQDRLMNTSNTWVTDITNAVNYVKQKGWWDRVIGLQLDDEIMTRAWDGLPRGQFPAISLVKGEQASDLVNTLLNDRSEELYRIAGNTEFGIGVAEVGGIQPKFPISYQKWWGLNAYLGYPGWYLASRQTVEYIYNAASKSEHLIMPIVPMFREDGRGPVTQQALADCYGPLLARYRTMFNSVGCFCLNYPNSRGEGIVQLGWQPFAKEFVQYVKSL